MEPLDLIIAGVIVLFILSVIVEKITSLVRSYVIISYLPFLVFASLIMLVIANLLIACAGNFAFGFVASFASILFLAALSFHFKKSSDFRINYKYVYNYFSDVSPESVNIDEKRKEKKIFLLSLSIGVLVSFSFRVDIFQIFTAEDITTSFGWVSDNFQNKGKYIWFSDMSDPHITPSFTDEVQAFAGILTTGFFLSFGSKFFHDLLDTLFLIKNYKQKAVDEKTYQVQTTKELTERLSMTNNQIVQKVLTENRDYIIGLDGVTSVGSGRTDNGKNGIIITVKKGFEKELEKKIQLKMFTRINDFEYQIPFEIEEIESEPSIRSYNSGNIIFNSGKNFGTIGCIVEDKYDKKKFLLSCYHVMIKTSKKINWNNFDTASEDDKIIRDRFKNEIASFTRGARDHEIDASIALLRDQTINPFEFNIIKYEDETISIKEPIDYPSIEYLEVRCLGATTKKLVAGVVLKKGLTVELNYGDGQGKWALHDLLAISRFDENGQRKDISDKGDSGSVIVDITGRAVGLLVGGDSTYTYAIPIKKILKRLQVNIPTTLEIL